jgi:hypothetical protein
MSAALAPRHERYPVRTVTRLTGLSADVVRVWERRYGVVAPLRGPRGTRLYSADDVAHLRLLARVVRAGRAIGDVARLDRDALEALVGEAAADGTRGPREGDGAGPLVGRMIEALERFDVVAIDRLLADALVTLGMASFVHQVARPLLIEVGDRQADGRLSIADEHLVSGLIRNLLSSLMRSRGHVAGPGVLLATPSGERHEFGLLLAALLVLDAGLRLYYLGPDLPCREIVAAAARAGVQTVGIGVVDGGNRARAAEEMRALERTLHPATELWLGGRDAAAVAGLLTGTRALVLDDAALVERETTRLRAAGGAS